MGNTMTAREKYFQEEPEENILGGVLFGSAISLCAIFFVACVINLIFPAPYITTNPGGIVYKNMNNPQSVMQFVGDRRDFSQVFDLGPAPADLKSLINENLWRIHNFR
jgi:hypothetical protein